MTTSITEPEINLQIMNYFFANRQSREQFKHKTELTKEIKYIIHKFCKCTNGKFYANSVNIIGSSVSGTEVGRTFEIY